LKAIGIEVGERGLERPADSRNMHLRDDPAQHGGRETLADASHTMHKVENSQNFAANSRVLALANDFLV
jgi:hypothetical protein